jgi:hypothetical protein
MKNLSFLSEAYAATQKQRQAISAHDALVERLAAREAALLDTCDLNSKDGFAELGELRLKLLIAPGKRTALEKQHEAGCALLTEALNRAFPIHNELHRAKSSALRDRMRKHQAAITPNADEAERMVALMWGGNPLASKIDGLAMTYEFSTNAAALEPEKVAQKMLEQNAELEAITIPDKL